MNYNTLAGAVLALALFVPASGRSQQTPTAPPTPKRGAPAVVQGQKSGPHPKQEPCWKQLGISQSVMDQRKNIQESTRSQVKDVCADSSLTEQQKVSKIKEIRQQAHQHESGLLTPQQEEALKQCQRERSGGGAHQRGVAPTAHSGGPCAE